MASDITLAVGDGSRRMTYAELAEARNISIPAARRLTLRHHWHKQIGNDGLVIVSVPLSALQQPRKSAAFRDPKSRHSDRSVDAATDLVRDAGSDTTRDPAIRALEHAVEGLCEQLVAANQRADRAEQQSDVDRERADRLHGELVEARAAERKAIDLVKYTSAEASDQRRRADDAVDAERIAREEAVGLRAELDARCQWGLRRRLRWALGRKR
jgi:hypothetical protein